LRFVCGNKILHENGGAHSQFLIPNSGYFTEKQGTNREINTQKQTAIKQKASAKMLHWLSALWLSAKNDHYIFSLTYISKNTYRNIC